MHENELTERIIGAGMEVHKRLGPGLLESIYEECLCIELDLLKIPCERQKVLPIQYRGRSINPGYRMDLWVAKKLVVELKAARQLTPVDEAQLLTQLRLTGCSAVSVSLLDPEARQVVAGVLVGHVDVRDLRLVGAAVAPGDHGFDRFFRALDEGLDAAVGKVADPAGEAERLRLAAAARPVEDPLDPAGDEEMRPDHQSFR